jgi:hypothetical protein
MLTKTKIALVATLVLGSTSLALAQGFDPNLANRYPHLANPHTYGYVAGANAPTRIDQAATFQSAPVRLRHGGDAGSSHHRRNAGQTFQSAPVGLRQSGDYGRSEFDVDRYDRASSPYAGGGS